MNHFYQELMWYDCSDIPYVRVKGCPWCGCEWQVSITCVSPAMATLGGNMCVRVSVSAWSWPGCCCLWLYTGKFRESLGWMRRGGGSGTGMAARHPEPVLMDLKLGDFATISRILQLISTILLPTVPTEFSEKLWNLCKVSECFSEDCSDTGFVFRNVITYFWTIWGFSYWVNLLLKDSWISMRFSFV